LRVGVVSRSELRDLERLLVVDMQPVAMFPVGGPRLGVIDHHPLESGYQADYLDVRPGYGAVSSMLTEYLRAIGESKVSEVLAAALLHGIKTDTDLLTRGVSTQDVQAFAFLQERADNSLLRRIERPSYSRQAARRFGAALASLRIAGGVALAHAGDLAEDEAHVLPELADFCLGLEAATLGVASGFVSDELVVTIRYGGRGELDAGMIARRLAGAAGQGGGHAAMARATLPAQRARERFGVAGDDVAENLLRYVGELTKEQTERPGLTRR
jgi:nanoRNase/pAp phosphatase (c-di-AMP/oligoRNAs hydrolase)